MAKLLIDTKGKEDIKPLVMSAILEKVKRLEIGLEKTKNKLEYFENKYRISTKEFVKKWTSEQLKGKDIEYVDWYGEYEIYQRLERDLKGLQKIVYAD